jgi:hypothetical protein
MPTPEAGGQVPRQAEKYAAMRFGHESPDRRIGKGVGKGVGPCILTDFEKPGEKEICRGKSEWNMEGRFTM